MEDLKPLLDEVYHELKERPDKGRVADYIP